MLVILSDDEDASTHYVIDWLLHLKIQYYRINDTSSVSIEYIVDKSNNIEFILNVKNSHSKNYISISTDEIYAFWYRRGCINLNQPIITNSSSDEFDIVKERINKYMDEENSKIVDFLHSYFTTIPHLGCFKDNFSINKLFILQQAKQEKMLTPHFMIANNKSTVKQFIHKHTYCIVKGIDKNGFTIRKKIVLSNLSKLVSASELEHFPENFNYSFIQQYIDKKADIRVFYLDGKIFSTAIFSQNDEKTKIDFRNYNEEKPNRIQPFKMPEVEKKKLRKLMNKLNYKTGSIDYLLDKNSNLYFLEINPIGQYGFISQKCNLFLDKEICKYFKQRCNV